MRRSGGALVSIPRAGHVIVVGAGGAARAVVLALARSGGSGVTVLNRTPERARATAALAGDAGSVVAAGDTRRDQSVRLRPRIWW